MGTKLRGLQAITCTMALCVIGTSAFAVNATVNQGTLCTKPGSAPIKDSDLASWIGGISSAAQKLLVLTECYGGNTASAFVGQANTAVISATIPGQQAVYGGYDNGAAAKLAPGAGTGATVHAGGVANKAASETPSQLGDGLPNVGGTTPNTGNLNPANFSLAPVNVAAGPIKSRHVVIYAGQPNATDVAQANQISNAFGNATPGTGTAGAAGTTVTTVGDNGAAPWNQQGTAAGLKAAIDAAKTAINNAADPSKEQFILFVTDHGDMDKTQKRTVTFTPGQRKSTTDNSNTSNNPSTNSSLQCFQTSEFVGSPLAALSTQTTAGGFSVSVDLSNDVDTNGAPGNNTPISVAALSSFFSSWVLDAVIQTGPNAGTDIPLTNPLIETMDLDGDSVIGDTPGEGVTLEFPVAPGFMVSSFFDVFTELDLTPIGPAPTTGTWNVNDPSEDTGEIPKIAPEPASLGVLGLGLVALLRRKR